MIPHLFHVGPLYFNMYGFCIALGMIVFVWIAGQDPLAKKYLKSDQLTRIMFFSLIIALIGSRLTYILQYPHDGFDSWYDYIAIWEGGLSLLGAIIPLIIILPIYLWHNKIPIIPLLDLSGIYGTLLQAIARLGCFFAGCCNGCPTTVAWAITYTHPESRAVPMYVPIHPSQIYSSLTLLVIFIFMYFVGRSWFKKPGQLFSAYLILSSLERFFNDFFRAEHYQETLYYNAITQNQLLAICLFGAGCIGLIVASMINSKRYHDNL